MRYRMLDPNGDYTLGQNGQNFWVDAAQGVGQAIYTKLRLWAGEYFLDLTQGVPWLSNVIGFGTQPTYDQVIRDVITSLVWVSSINTYSSSLDSTTRELTINANVTTIYGVVQVFVPIPLQGGFGIGPYSLRPFGG